MWTLMTFCVACTIVATHAREQQQEGNWVYWWPRADSEWKRNEPTLSIVQPLDVLRQRLQLDAAMRKQAEKQQRIRQNELLLHELGKRRT